MKIRSQLKALVAVALSSLMVPTLVHSAPGAVDLSFDPGSGVNGDGVEMIVAQPDGKLIIVGNFTIVKGAFRNKIARLNSDGSVDFGFDPGSGPDSTIYAVAVQADGKVLLGGAFTSINGTARNHVARLNSSGSLDASFDPGTGADSWVRSIAIQADGKMLIGGSFTSYNGTSRNRIAGLNADGSIDATFDPGTGADGVVLLIAMQSDGKALIGGPFATVQGIDRRFVARLNADGSLDTSFNPGTGANAHIYSMTVQADSKVLIGGIFTSFNGTSRNYIARLNADGSVDLSFNPGTGPSGFDSSVRALAVQNDGKMLITGAFDTVNGVSRPRVARLNTNGSVDTSFNAGTVAKADGLLPYILCVTIQPDGNVLIGGNFDLIAGNGRSRIARLDSSGNLDNTFNPTSGIGGQVLCMAGQTNGKLLIGGGFAKRIARLNPDGSFDSSFNAGTGANDSVLSVIVQPDGKVLVGGNFLNFNGQIRNRTVRLSTNGSIDLSWNTGTGANTTVRAMAIQTDGKVLVGGSFTLFNGTSRNRIARLNSDGSLDTSFDPGTGADTVVWPLAVQADGKVLIGGWFTTINGTSRNRIARLNTDGSLDTSFDPGSGVTNGSPYQPNGLVCSVAAQTDGKILIGGDFTSVNGTMRDCIARLHADGSVDASFVAGTSNSVSGDPSVRSVAVQADGKVLIAGAFDSVNGVACNLIARLNADGSLDTSFNPGTGADNPVSTITMQPDGKVLIGGAFSSVNDIVRSYIARLYADYLPSQLEISSVGNLSTLQLTGEVGQQYVLEYASDLTASNVWTALPSFTLTNSPQTVIDYTATNFTQRFYRAHVVTP